MTYAKEVLFFSKSMKLLLTLFLRLKVTLNVQDNFLFMA